MQDYKSADCLYLATCVLLNCESIIDSFCNKELVSNIFHVDKPMKLVSIGGKITTNIRCHINNLSLDQHVWFYAKHITNVMFLALIKK